MAIEQDGKGETTSALRKLVEAGAEISGAAIGGALGFMAAGPSGAAAGGAGGAAAASVLKHIGSEISSRLLSRREQVRVGGVLALVAAEVKQRFERGERVRAGGFFDANKDGRSDADELAESVLLKSQREPEEKKLPYMAHLFTSITFDASINPFLAQQLTKLAEQLTFRQLCLLRIGGNRG